MKQHSRKAKATLSLVAFFGMNTVLVGCGAVSGGIKGRTSQPGDAPNGADFLNSTFEVKIDKAVADGEAAAVAYAWLKSSKNTPVEGFTPQAESVSGTAVSCMKSNSDGLSVCLAKSTIEGSHSIELKNLGIHLSTQVTFKAKKPQPPGFAAGGGNSAVVGGVDELNPSISRMVAYFSYGEATHHNTEAAGEIRGGVVLTKAGGSQTMSNPQAPYQVMLRPAAKTNMQGVIHAE